MGSPHFGKIPRPAEPCGSPPLATRLSRRLHGTRGFASPDHSGFAFVGRRSFTQRLLAHLTLLDSKSRATESPGPWPGRQTGKHQDSKIVVGASGNAWGEEGATSPSGGEGPSLSRRPGDVPRAVGNTASEAGRVRGVSS